MFIYIKKFNKIRRSELRTTKTTVYFTDGKFVLQPVTPYIP